jgi:hypothetical protein
MKDILSFAPTVQGKLAEAALSGDLKPRTILLPLDFGFAALEWWSNMTAYEKALKLLNETETVSFLGYHVIPSGAYDAEAVKSLSGQSVGTYLSEAAKDDFPESTLFDLTVDFRDPDVYIKARSSEAKVVEANIAVCEGIVHLIETPLMFCDTEVALTSSEMDEVSAAVTKVANMLEEYASSQAPAPSPAVGGDAPESANMLGMMDMPMTTDMPMMPYEEPAPAVEPVPQRK